jgi:hypothetical protein
MKRKRNEVLVKLEVEPLGSKSRESKKVLKNKK